MCTGQGPALCLNETTSTTGSTYESKESPQWILMTVGLVVGLSCLGITVQHCRKWNSRQKLFARLATFLGMSVPADTAQLPLEAVFTTGVDLPPPYELVTVWYESAPYPSDHNEALPTYEEALRILGHTTTPSNVNDDLRSSGQAGATTNSTFEQTPLTIRAPLIGPHSPSLYTKFINKTPHSDFRNARPTDHSLSVIINQRTGNHPSHITTSNEVIIVPPNSSISRTFSAHILFGQVSETVRRSQSAHAFPMTAQACDGHSLSADSPTTPANQERGNFHLASDFDQSSTPEAGKHQTGLASKPQESDSVRFFFSDNT